MIFDDFLKSMLSAFYADTFYITQKKYSWMPKSTHPNATEVFNNRYLHLLFFFKIEMPNLTVIPVANIYDVPNFVMKVSCFCFYPDRGLSIPLQRISPALQLIYGYSVHTCP